MTAQSDPHPVPAGGGRGPGEGAPPQDSTDGSFSRNDTLEQAIMGLFEDYRALGPATAARELNIDSDLAESKFNDLVSQGRLRKVRVEEGEDRGKFYAVPAEPDWNPSLDECPHCLTSIYRGQVGTRCVSWHWPNTWYHRLSFRADIGYFFVAGTRPSEPQRQLTEAEIWDLTTGHRSRTSGATRPEGRTGGQTGSPVSPGTTGTGPGDRP